MTPNLLKTSDSELIKSLLISLRQTFESGDHNRFRSCFLDWLTRNREIGSIHSNLLLSLQVESLKYPSFVNATLDILQNNIDFFGPNREIAIFFIFFCRGELHRANGEESAIHFYQEAEEQLLEKCPRQMHIQRKVVLAGKAEFYRLNRDFDKAIDCYRQILEIDERHGTATDLVIAYCNKANIIIDSEDDSTSEPFWERAEKQVNVAKELIGSISPPASFELLGTVFGLNGKIEMTKGNYSAALQLFKFAKSEFEKAQRPERIGRSWRFIGLASHAMGNLENAIDAFQRSSSLLEHSGVMLDRSTTDADWLAAISPEKQGFEARLFETLNSIRNFQDSVKERIAYELMLGKYFLEIGNLIESKKILNLAKSTASKLNLHKEEIQANIALTRLARGNGDFGEADQIIAMCEEVLRTDPKCIRIDMESEIQYERFQIEQGLHKKIQDRVIERHTSLIRKLEFAVNFDSECNFRYCDRLVNLRSAYAAWTINSPGRQQQCLLQIENAHCDLSIASGKYKPRATSSFRYKTWDQLCADLSLIELKHGKSAAVNIMSMLEFEGSLLIAYVEIADEHREISIRQWDREITQKIKNMLCRPILGEDELYLENLSRFYSELDSIAGSFMEDTLSSFQKAPSTRNEYLYIIPYKLWHHFPFELFINKILKRPHYISISRIPCIKSLAEICARADNSSAFSGAVALVAGKSLLTGEIEKMSIANAFGPSLQTIPPNSLEPILTLDIVRKGMNCSIFHIFSHGSFNQQWPGSSYIDLYSGGENGRWALCDLVRELHLKNMPVVFMSACEAGQIANEEGQDFIGFPGAFLEAGAAACVGSNMRINEIPAAIIVDHFYSALRDGVVKKGLCRPSLALSAAIAKLRSMTRSEIDQFLIEKASQVELIAAQYNLLMQNKESLYKFYKGACPFDNEALWAGFSCYGLTVFPMTKMS